MPLEDVTASGTLGELLGVTTGVMDFSENGPSPMTAC